MVKKRRGKVALRLEHQALTLILIDTIEPWKTWMKWRNKEDNYLREKLSYREKAM